MYYTTFPDEEKLRQIESFKKMKHLIWSIDLTWAAVMRVCVELSRLVHLAAVSCHKHSLHHPPLKSSPEIFDPFTFSSWDILKFEKKNI